RVIELGPSIPRIGMDIERRPVILRCIEQVVVDAVPQRSEQGTVRVIVESHGQAGTETSRTGQAPAVGQAIRSLEELIKRQGHFVAGYKVVPHIPSRNRASRREVQGIELFSQI